MKRLIAVLLVLGVVSPLYGEISVNPSGKLSYRVDGSRIWSPLTPNPNGVLNPTGDLRGDGPPAISISPRTGWPEVAWASRNGDYDIRFAAWNGSGWDLKQITESPVNEWSPALAHDRNGNRYVGWTENGRLRLSGSPADSLDFVDPVGAVHDGNFVQVLALVVDSRGRLLASWIETGPSDSRVILAIINPSLDADGILRGGEDLPLPSMLAVAELAPDFRDGSSKPSMGSPVLAGPLSTPVPSQLEVHEEDGLIWIDWVQGGVLCFSLLDTDALTAPAALPLRGHREKDVEAGRREVRRMVSGRN